MKPKGLFNILVAATAVAVLQAAMSPAQAADWRDNGGPMVTDPSCAAFGTGVVCGAVGVSGSLIVNRFDGAAWTGFEELGGIVVRKPSCTRIGLLVAACVVIDAESGVQVNIYNGASWTGFKTMGGRSISDPACIGHANLGVVSTHCVIIGIDGALHAGRFDGTQWLGFQRLGGNYIYNPTCTQDWTSGGVFCAVVTVSGRLEGWKNTSGSWIKMPGAVGANVTADPNCSGIGRGKILCAVRSGSRLMVNRADDNSSWPQFTDLGGILTAAPSCRPEMNPLLPTPTATCAVRGTNSVVHVISFNGSTWGGYQSVPGVIMVGQPSCTFVLQAQTLCAVRGTDNRFYTLLGP